jgi:hypothetical protein
MSKIGCREIHFAKATNPHQIDFLVEKVKQAVQQMQLPVDYDVKVYKNVLTCCGIGGLGVIIEVTGPKEEQIKAIDLRAISRVLEFCEEEGLEVGHHSYGPYETL